MEGVVEDAIAIGVGVMDDIGGVPVVGAIAIGGGVIMVVGDGVAIDGGVIMAIGGGVIMAIGLGAIAVVGGVIMVIGDGVIMVIGGGVIVVVGGVMVPVLVLGGDDMAVGDIEIPVLGGMVVLLGVDIGELAGESVMLWATDTAAAIRTSDTASMSAELPDAISVFCVMCVWHW